jgi:hypothetical protein
MSWDMVSTKLWNQTPSSPRMFSLVRDLRPNRPSGQQPRRAQQRSQSIGHVDRLAMGLHDPRGAMGRHQFVDPGSPPPTSTGPPSGPRQRPERRVHTGLIGGGLGGLAHRHLLVRNVFYG